MKKSYLIIAAAAALLVSCSDNDTFKSAAQEQQAERPLSFSAYADKVTKGSNSTALNDFYTVFGVYGWKTVKKLEDPTQTESKSVFSNEPNEYFSQDAKGSVVYNGDNEKPSIEWAVANPYTAAWYYENIRFWDKMATGYEFFAIAPYESTPTYTVAAGANNISIATASSKYDISTEYNLARTNLSADPVSETEAPKAELTYSGFKKDYMIADKFTTTPVGTVTTTDVQLVFHHILTKLNVKIQKSENYKAQQVLKVNELKIAGLAKEGNFVYDTNMTTDGWNTSGTYEIDINQDYALANAETNYDKKYWIETLIFPQTTTCKAAGAQPTAADLEGSIYLYIQYQIGTEVYNTYYDLAYIFDATTAPVPAVLYTAQDQEVIDSQKQVGDVKTPAVPGKNFEFKQGSQYNLTMTVGPDPIHFDAEVIEWTTQTEGTVSAN
jgi:hypothetical protein